MRRGMSGLLLIFVVAGWTELFAQAPQQADPLDAISSTSSI